MSMEYVGGAPWRELLYHLSEGLQRVQEALIVHRGDTLRD
jgi:hypothetical protein